jgi:membrane protease subunit HflK
MLTGDLNLADVEWVVQYRISNSYQYLFKVRNADKTLRDMAESAVRKTVGDRTVNEVLTVGRQEVASNVEKLLQQMCEEYENGIRIDQVVLQDVNPPETVKPSFNAVNQAQQEKETLINEAESEYNRVIPRARGEAKETIQLAELLLNRVNRAKGEATALLRSTKPTSRPPKSPKNASTWKPWKQSCPSSRTKSLWTKKATTSCPC